MAIGPPSPHVRTADMAYLPTADQVRFSRLVDERSCSCWGLGGAANTHKRVTGQLHAPAAARLYGRHAVPPVMEDKRSPGGEVQERPSMQLALALASEWPSLNIDAGVMVARVSRTDVRRSWEKRWNGHKRLQSD